MIAVLALLASTATIAEVPPALCNPAGSLVLGGGLAVRVGKAGAAFGFGVSLGYAVVTGVVPGVRGVLIAGEGVGAELAATLTLTPPFDWPVLPFAVAEGGHRWDPGGRGWIYGGGGGVSFGSARLGVQTGWILRRYEIEDGPTLSESGPLFAVSASF